MAARRGRLSFGGVVFLLFLQAAGWIWLARAALVPPIAAPEQPEPEAPEASVPPIAAPPEQPGPETPNPSASPSAAPPDQPEPQATFLTAASAAIDAVAAAAPATPAALGRVARNAYAARRSRVPRVLHQTWKSVTPLPRLWVELMGTWRDLNPGWVIVLWSDAAAREFIGKHHADLAEVYDALEMPVMRADLLRYALLYTYGGVYADADVEAVAPFDSLLARFPATACLLTPEPRAHAALLEATPHREMISNAIFASEPGHPLWRAALDRIKQTSERGGDPVSLTGPRRLSDVWRAAGRPCDLLDVGLLNPAADATALVNRVKELCDGRDGDVFPDADENKHLSPAVLSERIEECEALRRRNFTNADRKAGSFAAHHWVHTWIAGVVGYDSNVGAEFGSAAKELRHGGVVDVAETTALTTLARVDAALRPRHHVRIGFY